MNTTTNYQQQALDFMNKTGVTMTFDFLRNDKYFPDDTETRDIYDVAMSKGARVYNFQFGQSIADSGFYYQYKTGKTKFPIDRKYLLKENKGKVHFHIKMKDSSFVPNLDIIHYPKEPTPYDILACLTKSDPGTFEDFCSEFGYDTDSRRAEKTYKAVKEEWLQVSRLFTDEEITELQEIQ